MDAELDLVSRCLKREAASQKLLYQRYAPTMYGICLRYASNADDAEDLLQEGFIRIFCKLHHFRGDGSLEGWMRRIMVTTALNYCTAHIKNNLEVGLNEVVSSATFSEDALSILTTEEMLRIIHELPVGFRTVFNLFVVEGYSHYEIGEMLGINENTSKSHLHRAKVLIRKRLAAIGISDK
ncbi:MAG: sigma-70 family RNA polymerase sigma factor [Bacteroidales bacterium]|nr:sigma-70 family RNA polymerase sigma factor [Bacteroidales bacterium]